ncbi:MAG: hypothetical protein AAFQ51_17235, partial [Pseudomonadota bacterium]
MATARLRAVGMIRAAGLGAAALLLGACAQPTATTTSGGAGTRAAQQPDTAVDFDPTGAVQ